MKAAASVFVAYLLERGLFYSSTYLLPNFLRVELGAQTAGILCNVLALSVFWLPSLLYRFMRPRLALCTVVGALTLAAGWLSAHFRLSSLVLLGCTALGSCLLRPLLSNVASALPDRIRSVLAIFLLANLGGILSLVIVSMLDQPMLVGAVGSLALAALGLVTKEQKTDIEPLRTSASLGLWWLLPGFTLLNAQTLTVVFVHLSKEPVLLGGFHVSATLWGLWFSLAAALAIPTFSRLVRSHPAACAVIGMLLSGLAFLMLALSWTGAGLAVFFFLSGLAEILLLPASYVDGLKGGKSTTVATVDFFALQGFGYLLSILVSVAFGAVSPAWYFGALAVSSLVTLGTWRLYRWWIVSHA